MVYELPVKEPEPVSCENCHREIPNAASLSIEGQEYIYYFCGHGCYSRWHEQKLGREKRAHMVRPRSTTQAKQLRAVAGIPFPVSILNLYLSSKACDRARSRQALRCLASEEPSYR